MFNCLLWSFKLYKVNLNKRPTKLWCLTQHRLVPLCQGFEVPISMKYTKAVTLVGYLQDSWQTSICWKFNYWSAEEGIHTKSLKSKRDTSRKNGRAEGAQLSEQLSKERWREDIICALPMTLVNHCITCKCVMRNIGHKKTRKKTKKNPTLFDNSLLKTLFL